jgi:hypothetical protein
MVELLWENIAECDQLPALTDGGLDSNLFG